MDPIWSSEWSLSQSLFESHEMIKISHQWHIYCQATQESISAEGIKTQLLQPGTGCHGNLLYEEEYG